MVADHFIVQDHRWGASLFDSVLYEFFGYDRYDHRLIWPAVISGVPAVLMLIGAIVVLALGGPADCALAAAERPPLDRRGPLRLSRRTTSISNEGCQAGSATRE